MNFPNENKIIEAYRVQERSLLLMSYDLSKTYTENLNLEQRIPPLLWTFPGTNQISNWVLTWDKHDWATFVGVTTGILGMIPSPLSPVLLGISFATELADAAMYTFIDDDPYMGGLVLALSVLPLGELMRVLPGSRRILAKGGKYCKELLQKAKSLSGKKALSKAEKEIAEEATELIKGAAKNADELAVATAKGTARMVIEGLIKAGGKLLWGTCLLLTKVAWSVGKMVILIGGIYYTYDEIYLALYGDDKEKMKLRYNSRFQQLIRALKILSNVQSAEDQAIEFLEANGPVLEKDPNKLAQVDPTKKQEAIAENNRITAQKAEEQQKSQVLAPTLNDILMGKINPYDNKPFVIQHGQKGENVTKIQLMLKKLGYETTLQGYNTKSKAADNFFGDNTMDAVLIFQSDNGLEETGIVDSKTLKKLLQKIKNK